MNTTPFWQRSLWVVALVAVLALIGTDSLARWRTIQVVTESRVGNAPVIQLDPHSLTGYQFNQHALIVPAIGTDGYHYMMQTERMLAGVEGIRVRHTDYDNPPDGRAVHWASYLHWVAGALALGYSAVTGQPAALGVEWAGPWANTACLALFIVAVVPLVARRFGSIPASLLALGFFVVYPYYEFSFVGYFDHQGLAASYNLAMVLFLAAGGAGWVKIEGADPALLNETDRSLYEWLPARPQAKHWFVASAIFGGVNLWISTASTVPAMMGIGIAALFVTGLLGRGNPVKSPWKTDPTLWRVWGITGSITSLFFYLLEYAPSHFTWRLEVNHPFYALAWLAAGDALCRLCQFLQVVNFDAKKPAPRNPRPPARNAKPDARNAKLDPSSKASATEETQTSTLEAAVASPRFWVWFGLDVLAVLIVPACIFIFGEKVFVIPDYFLWSLHTDYIIEFRNLPRQLSYLSTSEIMGGISLVPLLVFPLAALVCLRDIPRPWRAVLGLGLFPALVVFCLALKEVRWLGTSCAIWLAALVTTTLVLQRLRLLDWLRVVITLVVAAIVIMAASSWIWWYVLVALALAPLTFGLIIACNGFRWEEALRNSLSICAGIFLALVLVPFPFYTIRQWCFFGIKLPITQLDITELITRDASYRIRERLGSQPGVIVSGPTTTTWMMFWGGFKGLGTLYWENIDGLKATAAIYSASTPDEALELVKKYGVTDIAIYSWDPFAQEYAKLSRGLRLNDAPPPDAFVLELLNSGKIPHWLRPLPYLLPPQAELKGQWVFLLEVDADQSEKEAAVRVGLYLLGENKPTEGENQIRAVLLHDPNYLPALVELARLQQLRGQTDAFHESMRAVHLNLAQAPAMELDERVDLAIDLATAGDTAGFHTQFAAAMNSADEKSLRRCSPEVLLNLVKISYQLGLTEKYSKIIYFAVTLLPPEGQAQYYSTVADNEYRLGHHSRAVQFYRLALQLEPTLYSALNNIAMILASTRDDSLRNPPEALDFAQRAAQVDNYQHVESYDTLAVAEAAVGDYAEAQRQEHKALDLISSYTGKTDLSSLAGSLGKRLQLFEQNQPYRQ
jgi:tetratricopeptide (TPR) repeat protein